MPDLHSLQDVVNWRLCTGCGACSYACPSRNVQLVNLVREGIRPQLRAACGACRECLAFCPGSLVHGGSRVGAAGARTVADGLGQVLEIWEGYAADPGLRFRASSGGALSALVLYCLEQEGMSQVLHSAADPDVAWLNRTVASRTREEVLAGCGSRYAPSSPCEGLAALEEAEHPGVFVGKPCDVAAVSALRHLRPALHRKLGLVLTFFCAGVPATQGTLDLFTLLGTRSEEVRELRYRGQGWPGSFEPRGRDGILRGGMSYRESWRHLTAYRPLRCKLCPDGMGEAADIACGDAWRHQHGEQGGAGMSLLLVRTARGQEMLRRAIAAGYLVAEPVTAEAALASQPSLLRKRRELHGRLQVFRWLRIPCTRFPDFLLATEWRALPWWQRLRVMAGTLRRIVSNGWHRPASETELVASDAINTPVSSIRRIHTQAESSTVPVASVTGKGSR